jgi:dipeptidase D
MINMDSEEIGVFSIGCAGGRDTVITLPLEYQKPSGDTLLEVFLSGLRGGHSGVDIHEGRGNAIKILNRFLYGAAGHIPLHVVSIEGGDKHNAIPREVVARIVVRSADVPELKSWFEKAVSDVKVEFSPVEKNISFSVQEQQDTMPDVLAEECQKTLLSLLYALPHGPLAMSRTIDNLVETSNNVASIKMVAGEAIIVCSSRSSNDSALEATLNKLIAITGLAGGTVEQPEGYPGWMPNLDSEILKISMETYKQVTGKEAKYEAIHAGLECGLIGEKFPGMDMISIGPTILHPHSPDECVHIGSVNDFYKHVLKILEVLV